MIQKAGIIVSQITTAQKTQSFITSDRRYDLISEMMFSVFSLNSNISCSLEGFLVKILIIGQKEKNATRANPIQIILQSKYPNKKTTKMGKNASAIFWPRLENASARPLIAVYRRVTAVEYTIYIIPCPDRRKAKNAKNNVNELFTAEKEIAAQQTIAIVPLLRFLYSLYQLTCRTNKVKKHSTE